MTISIYGVGCAKCRRTEEIVRRVLAETGITAEVVKIGDVKEIVMAGVISTPAVAVDGVLKVAGRVPSPDEVKTWIS